MQALSAEQRRLIRVIWVPLGTCDGLFYRLLASWQGLQKVVFWHTHRHLPPGLDVRASIVKSVYRQLGRDVDVEFQAKAPRL